MTTPEIGTEKAAPASGEGAGAVAWADTAAATESATMAKTETFFPILLTCAIL